MRRQSGEQARARYFAAAVLLGAGFVALEVDGQAAGQTRLSVRYGNLPLSFEANQGQSEERVKFLARGQGYSLFLTPTEAVLSLRAPARHKRSAAERAAAGQRAKPDEPAQPVAVVRMRLVGASKHPQITGLDPLPGRSNYFIGDDPARWQRDVPNYARVKYAGVYPGIDLVYYGNQRQLEYDIVVAPDADPRRIALAFEGVQKLSLDPEGNLVLRTPQGDIAQHKPVIYQDIGGKRQPVGGRYVLHPNDRVGFQVARYDTTRPLVIDPVLSYSTYLGGSGNDVGHAIAVHSDGTAYVTGETNSVNFPGASASLIQPNLLGSYDVFVTRLNAAGDALVYSTYLGGSGGDFGYAIAVDTTGNAYVTGETDSPTVPGPGNIPFPRVGAFQAVYAGGGDAFVTKINTAGNALVYSTYLGGSGTERGYGIAVDGFDTAYVTGHTSSVNGTGNFPTVNPFQAQNGSLGSFDAFVTKVNAAGNGLVYSTYLGGNGSEYSLDGGAIAVDSDGNAYVAGTTASTNFPGASTSTIQPSNGGGTNDAFVIKFNSAGSALLYSTYLGGTAYDAVNGIAIDTARNAYVVGYTDSPNFPTASPLQASRNGPGEDAFVAKLNAAGSALVYSTYLGGSAGERAYAVAVDGGGNAYVSGFTSSSDFPTEAPFQPVRGGTGDAFVSKLNAAGSALVYSTYLGGSTGGEHGYGIAVDGAGNAYVTGETNSTNFPTVGPFQGTYGGSGSDAFVAKIIINGEPTGLVEDAHASVGTSSNVNSILEPGETFLVNPSWRNASASPLALTGTASAFTGPAGAAYSLLDTSTDYGTIAPGATADSFTAGLSSYRFFVSNPASRPAAHWDATFLETLNIGIAMTWTLHVGRSFTDVPTSNGAYRFVETLLHNGITAGCGGGNFCPGIIVNRWQMSVFLATALAGPNGTVPVSGTVPSVGSYNCTSGGSSLFGDVPPTDAGCRFIHYIYGRGLTSGCGGGNYCPANNVTRWQMAVFLATGMVGPSGTVPVSGTVPGVGGYNCTAGGISLFGDVPPTDAGCRFIHFIYANGVTAGCGGGNYCSASFVTRWQMAVFLVTAFRIPFLY